VPTGEFSDDFDGEVRPAGSGWDVGADEYHPTHADSDSDGMADAWEVWAGLNPLNGAGNDGAAGDPDGDGRENHDEYLADTQPTNAASVLRISGVAITSIGPRIFWQGGVNAVQHLEKLSAPNAVTGAIVFTNLPPTATASDFTDAWSASQSAFYRVRAFRPN
jgi:hypothetical protein